MQRYFAEREELLLQQQYNNKIKKNFNIEINVSTNPLRVRIIYFLIIFFSNTYTLYIPLGSADKAPDYARVFLCRFYDYTMRGIILRAPLSLLVFPDRAFS